MLFKFLKHFKTDFLGIGMFTLGIVMGQGLDKSYVLIAMWIGVIALTINAIIGFIDLKKTN